MAPYAKQLKGVLIAAGELVLLFLIMRHLYVMFLALEPKIYLVDFKTYYFGTKLMTQHVTPYLAENMAALHLLPTIHSPGTFLFFLPFLALDLRSASILWFTLNAAMLLTCLHCAAKHFKLYGSGPLWRPNSQNLPKRPKPKSVRCPLPVAGR